MTRSSFSSIAEISSAAILMEAYAHAEGGVTRSGAPETGPRAPAEPSRWRHFLSAAQGRITEIALPAIRRPAMAATRVAAVFGAGFALGAGMVFLAG